MSPKCAYLPVTTGSPELLQKCAYLGGPGKRVSAGPLICVRGRAPARPQDATTSAYPTTTGATA